MPLPYAKHNRLPALAPAKASRARPALALALPLALPLLAVVGVGYAIAPMVQGLLAGLALPLP